MQVDVSNHFTASKVLPREKELAVDFRVDIVGPLLV
jgi:hypothetical protein